MGKNSSNQPLVVQLVILLSRQLVLEQLRLLPRKQKKKRKKRRMLAELKHLKTEKSVLKLISNDRTRRPNDSRENFSEDAYRPKRLLSRTMAQKAKNNSNLKKQVIRLTQKSQ